MNIQRLIFLIALLPALLLAAVLSLYFTLGRMNDQIDSLHHKGMANVRYMAQAAEYPVFAGDGQALQGLAQAALSDPEVFAIEIYAMDGQRLAYAQRVAAVNERVNERDLIRFSRLIGTSGIDVLDLGGPAAGAPPSSSAAATGRPLGRIELQLSLKPVQARQAALLEHSLVITLAGLLIAVLAAWGIGNRVSQPLRELTRTVGELKHGRLGARSESPMSGDLAVLQTGVNEMAQTIARSQEDLQGQVAQATSHLVRKIEEAELANRQLRAASHRAEQAAAGRMELLARVSHELRTPLNGVMGYTDLLSRSSLDDDQRDYVEIIKRSSSELCNLASDVLNYASIETGHAEVIAQDFSLTELLDSIRLLLLPAAAGKGLAVYVIPYADVPDALHGDPVLIKQVLVNLVGNAIKFTDRGRVVLKALLQDEQPGQVKLAFEVSDTGRGIPEDRLGQLFEAFSQAHADVPAREQGSGLGLAIAKHLTELMNGRITVSSREGVGSRFSVELPLRTRQAPPEPEVRSEDVLVVGSRRESVNEIRALLAQPGNQVSAFTAEELTAPGLRRLLSQTAGLRRVLDISTPDEGLWSLLEDAEAGFDLALYRHPAEQSPLPADRAGRVRSLLVPRQTLRALVYGADRPPQRDPERPAAVDGHRRRVLVVDDNPVNLALTGRLLEEEGVEVLRAASGTQALEMATTGRLDAVLMDIQMPDMDGVETTRRLRLALGEHPPPIVALTANALPSERERLLSSGLDGCITKPVSRAELRLWLDEAADAAPRKPAHGRIELERSLRLDIAEQRDRLGGALAETDAQALLFRVHRLLGSLSYAGNPRLIALARELEAALRQQSGRVDAASELHDRFEQFLTELDAAIGHWRLKRPMDRLGDHPPSL